MPPKENPDMKALTEKLNTNRKYCNHKDSWQSVGSTVFGPPVIEQMIIITTLFCTKCNQVDYHKYIITLEKPPITKPQVMNPNFGKIES